MNLERILTRAACSLGVWAALAAQAAQFKFPSQTFTVPDGFEVELVAGPTLVERPISASFDEQGRLYVTDSSGSNDKVEKQLEEKPHRVVRLEDTDADGRFDRTGIFAGHLMFPEGCLWFDGSLYVSAVPSIWKLTDTNNEGVADRREEWHQGKTATGCANDLHGPYPGPDGWIYWCKGAFAKQTYERAGRPPFGTRAAHIFRSPPNHADIEPVLTGGMDNPVGVAFTPEGERILCGTFLLHPEAGKRDGLIHAIYGGVYGKVNEVTDEHKQTGELLPIMTHMGAAAPSSVIRYEAGVLGAEYRDNLFVCAFNMHKVTRHVLEPDGATFKTSDSDFLVSDNTDFHPTDVLEDADGSLLVVDTGGWYKLCCPTSQLAKPDVLGAIYRIRRLGTRKLDDPRGLKLAWGRMAPGEIVKLLDEERPAVRKRAIHELGKAGEKAVAPLAGTLNSAGSIESRRNAVWALTRLDTPAARASVRMALTDKEESIRHAAVHSVSLWRDAQALDQLLVLLKQGSAAERRAVAEALGRIGNPKATGPLFAAFEKSGPMDRAQEHSLLFALIEIGDSQGVASRLRSDNVLVHRAALIACDQMDNGGINAEMVAPLLASPEPRLRQTAVWVAGHHPDWGESLAGFFRERLRAKDLGEAQRQELQVQLARFANSPAIQELLGAALGEADPTEAGLKVIFAAMSHAGLKETPAAWTKALLQLLNSDNAHLVGEAVATAGTLAPPKKDSGAWAGALQRIAHQTGLPAEVRLGALSALPNGLRNVEPELFSFLCSNLDAAKPVMTRSSAASTLAKAQLKEAQLLILGDALRTVGPLELTKLLSSFEQSTNEAVGLKLVGALRESKSVSGLRRDVFQKLVTKYPPAVRQQGQKLLASLDVDAAQQNAHLEEMLRGLTVGEIRRGQALFNSPKTACSSCHTMGYLGGNVGPDLTRIGQIRTERDLLEAIVYPSASFVRSYEPFTVTTKDNEQYNGVLRKDAPDEVVLASGPGTEVHLARSEITAMLPGTVSVMPAGLAEQLTKQELADLLAFLKATKWGAN